MRQDIFKSGIGQVADFLIAAILYWMRHVADGRIKTERGALGLGRFYKLVRSDEDAGNPAGFQVSDVVHTARRA